MSFVFDLDQHLHVSLVEATAVVGGKAANLGVMAAELGLPVPPGFVVSTAACREFLAGAWPADLDAEISEHLRHIELAVGRRFGDPIDPLLLSVRSGAPVSMPGMLDTILNLGLNDETVAGLAAVSNDPEFAADCRGRFATMFTSIVGVEDVPEDPWEQLRAAVKAVFRSWNGDRARAYRAIEGIGDDLGTAVTVQAMVFGNSGPDSGTGVLFTRNPSTGERAVFGDVMFQAQGEDVVSGTYATEPLNVLDDRMPEVGTQLWGFADMLEKHYADMCDVEFTIERGTLWMLQVRTGKRSPQAALRMAVEMADDPEFPLSRQEAVRRVRAHLVDPPSTWTGRPNDLAPLACGLPASPGLVAGEIVTSIEGADAHVKSGTPFILVRAETSPEDVPTMGKAAGVLTSRGGLASHAAVVARGWGVPAVVGAGDVALAEHGISISGQDYALGETLTIDGSTGEVFLGLIPGHAMVAPEVATLLSWADELGIELPTGTGAAEPDTSIPDQTVGSETPAPVADDVIAALSIKTISLSEGLAASLLTSVENLQPVIDQLVEDGLVRIASGMARLTEGGLVRASKLLETERFACGPDDATTSLDAFVALDRRMKDAVTAWQMREVAGEPVVNDHADESYDASVLGQLRTLHAETTEWLAALRNRVGRFASYGARLDRAISAIQAGDRRFVSSPRVDSYHSIWFELHEELIRLAGRTREDESSAGRA